MSLNRAKKMFKFLKTKKGSQSQDALDELEPNRSRGDTPHFLSATDLSVDIFNRRSVPSLYSSPSNTLRHQNGGSTWLAEIPSGDDSSTYGVRSDSAASDSTGMSKSVKFCLTLASKSRIMQENVLVKTTIPVGSLPSPPQIRRFLSTRATDQDDQPSILLKDFHLENRVCRLTMNDPKKRNALSLKLLEALKAELSACEQNSKLRAVILAATPPVFSAGHDLRELTTKTGLTYHAKVFNECSEVMMLLQNMQLPVIAEVCGIAAAAGCQLAASCDIVVAADNARFSVPGAKAGIFCSTPGIALARAVPRKVALDMLLTGDPINAQDAQRAGLVSRVVAETDVSKEALIVAERICDLSRPVVSLGKAFYYLQIEQDRNNAYRLGERVMLENLRMKDAQEGIDAFIEKRHPKWTHSTDKVH